MNEILKPGETLDDLQNGYYIIQKEKAFRFGVDAVLLSDFANIKRTDNVLEMGTGTGIIPILIHAKKHPKFITAIEIQEDMAEMAGRSIAYNDLENNIDTILMDLKKAPEILGKGKYSAIITNPPYLKKGSGIINPEIEQASARFEINCTLSDVIDSAHQLLMPKGRFYMVHRTDRLADIICAMRDKGIEPKKMRFVHSSYDKKPHLLLIEGVKGGKPELKLMEPLYIYDDKGNYSKEINAIYGRAE
ncbi:MAG: tRNA1(Val) (adenine(37)-N6)-methyltransferase [Firmicutes bacterium]|nr:tRNA1(Val) (adenine(37)-N6)-methyltransferase [Bacillota bacterium]